jgi:hypothetical protein
MQRAAPSAQIEKVVREMVILSREIQDSFTALFPSTVAETTEMCRIRIDLRSHCGRIITLLESGNKFKSLIKQVLDLMSVLHVALCYMFDRLGIRYEIAVSPGNLDVAELETPAQDSDAKIREFIDEMTDLLKINWSTRANDFDKLDGLKEVLKKVVPSKLSEKLVRVDGPQTGVSQEHRLFDELAKERPMSSLGPRGRHEQVPTTGTRSVMWLSPRTGHLWNEGRSVYRGNRKLLVSSGDTATSLVVENKGNEETMKSDGVCKDKDEIEQQSVFHGKGNNESGLDIVSVRDEGVEKGNGEDDAPRVDSTIGEGANCIEPGQERSQPQSVAAVLLDVH